MIFYVWYYTMLHYGVVQLKLTSWYEQKAPIENPGLAVWQPEIQTKPGKRGEIHIKP